MTTFTQWGVRAQITTVIAVLTGVVLLGNAIGAFQNIEPLLPATREFARQLFEQARADETAQTTETNRKLDVITLSILDQKLIALDGQITSLTNSLDMAISRAEAAPTDQFLQSIVNNMRGQLAVVTKQRAEAACEESKLQFGTASC